MYIGPQKWAASASARGNDIFTDPIHLLRSSSQLTYDWLVIKSIQDKEYFSWIVYCVAAVDTRRITTMNLHLSYAHT